MKCRSDTEGPLCGGRLVERDGVLVCQRCGATTPADERSAADVWLDEMRSKIEAAPDPGERQWTPPEV